ncbi:MAG: Gfo/Idh/MocA family oxidoreductase [Myxococcota bacterium]|nr:Gfo/Idh/MocA family oxidoreductase [Myxococcota bacterium]
MSARGPKNHDPISSSVQCAVIGLGRAGQMRVKALESSHRGVCAAKVTRRGASAMSLDEVYASDRIDAVLICLENELHHQVAQASLASGKHVLVEYPLADSASQAQSLFHSARESGLILHVGLVGLLSPIHEDMRTFVQSEDWRRVVYEFRGGFYGWLETEVRAGHFGQLALARLHRLRDWFGQLSLGEVQVRLFADGYVMKVCLSGADGAEIELVENRRRGQSRGVGLVGESAAGLTHAFNGPGRRSGVFAQDTQAFLQRVLTHDRDGCYVASGIVLEVMALADRISERVTLT